MEIKHFLVFSPQLILVFLYIWVISILSRIVLLKNNIDKTMDKYWKILQL